MSRIEFKNVSKVYDGGIVALDNVSFVMEEDEFVTFTGYSGAGKTTILKMLLLEEKPSEGEILINDEHILEFSKSEMSNIRRNIGVIFQNYRLLKYKTVFENISFVMEVSGFDDEHIEEDVSYVLDLVNLQEKANFFPTELSGGEQQRVAIARAIVTRPEIIIADEPTGNLDPNNTFEVVDILKQINKLGHTILLTSHDKNVVETVKSRVITLEDGRIVRDNKTGGFSL